MRQRGFTEVFILIGLLLAVGIVGMVYFATQSGGQRTPSSSPRPNNVQPSPLSFSTPTPSSTKETKDGLIYTNYTLGYEVLVPKDLVVEEGEFIGTPGEVVFVPPSSQNKKVYRTLVSIVSTKDEKTKYEPDTLEEYDQWLAKPVSNGRGQRVYKTANLEVDGIPAVKYATRALYGDTTEAYYGIVTYFRKDGQNYYIELGGDELRAWEVMSQYNKILSSFKFTQ